MKKIAFLTSNEIPNLIPEDQKLRQVFERAGYETFAVIWDDSQAWNNYDFIFVRNTWDYADKAKKFKEVLEEIKNSQAVLINDLETLTWNMDKTYLIELSKKAFPVPLTKSYDSFDLDTILIGLGKTQKYVLKPLFGAGGRHTYCMTIDEMKKAIKTLEASFASRKFVVQPFIESVTLEGEYSFIYFNNHFSHAVLKRAREGEFRIHEEFGGNVEAYVPTQEEKIQVLDLLERSTKQPFYARVDVARDGNGGWLIMELELIEPQLFFPWAEGSMARFVKEFEARYV